MIQSIEILDEQNQLIKFSSNDLPFEISLITLKIHLENEEKKLIISSLKSGFIELNDSDNKKVCAHIAEEDEHIFLQPVLDKNETDIFHNDVKIKKSVWLKSGDIIQISNKLIKYIVSGNIIYIKISKKKYEDVFDKILPATIPPLIKLNQSTQLKQINVSKKEDEEKQSLLGKNKLKKNILIIILILLIILASFVLFAKTIEITISPKADNVELSGILPAVKINDRYLLLSGQYDLSIYKKGYQSINETLNINAEKNKFEYKLKELPGRILFEIEPDKYNQIFSNNILLDTNAQNKNKEYEIDKGKHSIVIKNPRYKIYQKIIKVEGKGKQQKYKINLTPNWAFVKILSKTKNTSINIYSITQEKNIYESELINSKKLELIAGQYTMTMNKDKFKEKKVNFNLKANDDIEIKIEQLDPKDAILKLTSIPSGSIIRLDGKYIGETPKHIIMSPDDEHEIELSLSGYNEIKKIIKLQADETSEQNFSLHIMKGLVFISVVPSNAKLIIDGKFQKKSSGKFNLNRKNHIITVKANGYKSETIKFRSDKYTKNLSFNLKKISSSSQKKLESKRKPNNKISQTLAARNKNYNNSLAQKMILNKPAIFIMGSKKNESGRGSNEREYQVKLDYSFYLSEKEVSNKQYRQFVPRFNSGSVSGKSLDTDSQPVVNISWNEAAKFANWLSKLEGLKPYYKEISGQLFAVDVSKKINGYRLPFEAEWLLAARGIGHRKYPWPGSFPPQNMNGNFADESARSYVSNIIDGYNDQYSLSAPIGSYKPNLYGYYDLGGNVSEWCQDYYSPYPGLMKTSGTKKNRILINPTGPIKGTHKVVKDSSWRDASITELRLSYRSYSKNKAKDIGFRLARYSQ